MVYITGDIHGHIDIEKLSNEKWPEQKYLTEDDLLIIAGDFGLIYHNVQTKQEKYWLDWLNDKPYKIAFIDGNHENFELLNTYPEEEFCGGKVGRITDNIRHLKRGEIFNFDGVKTFCFGGAQSYDKTMRVTGISWWPEEVPSSIEMYHAINTLANNNNSVDVIITHTLPVKIIELGLKLYNEGQIDPTTVFLQQIYDNVSFKKWYAGHFHIDKQIEQINLLYQTIVPLI